ncbi:MAG: hypothetical protein ACOYMR_05645 [Ilumatobacteraceae bacterium]|jgi:hypothetical protein
MGQQIAVVAKPSHTPGVLRFEANRNLTGMGHESFSKLADATGVRPAASLARRLLDTGKVSTVHVFGNMITVDLAKGHDGTGLDDVIANLYQYWKPGMELPTFDDVAAEAPADSGAAVAEGASPAEAEFLRRVPAVLVERSRAAMAKWKATH